MERDRNRVLLGVLIQTVNRGIDRVDFGAGLARDRPRLLRLCSGCGGYLVGVIGSGLSLADSSLSAGVDVLDILGVLRIDFVQLIQLAPHRVKPLVYPLLAGEWVHMSPEPLLRRRAQFVLSTGGGLRRRRLGAGSTCRLLSSRRYT